MWPANATRDVDDNDNNNSSNSNSNYKTIVIFELDTKEDPTKLWQCLCFKMRDKKQN